MPPLQRRSDLAERLMDCSDRQERRRLVSRNAGLADRRTLALLERRFDRAISRDLRLAGRVLDASRAVAPRCRSDEARAAIHRMAGVLGHTRGQRVRARRSLLRAAELYDESRPLLAGDVHRIRIDVAVGLGDVDEAEEAFESARRCYRRAGGADARRRGSLFMNLGHAYHRVDRLRDALSCYRKARRLYIAADEPRRIAAIEFNIANILASQDRMDQARELYEESRRIFSTAGLTLLRTKTDRALAELDRLEGRLDDCLARLMSTRDVRLSHDDRVGAANDDLEMARVLAALNRTEAAERHALEAERLFRSAGHLAQVGHCELIRGRIALARSRFAAAARLSDQAERRFRSEGNELALAEARLLRATASIGRGDTAAARRLARGAVRLFESQRLPSRRCGALIVEAESERAAGRPTRARTLALQALAVARRLGDDRAQYRSSLLIGHVESERGRHGLAFRRYVAAERCVERMRTGVTTDESRLAFSVDKSEVYEALVLNRLERGDRESIRQALRYAERGKARSLAEALARSGHLPVPPGVGRKLAGRLRSLERKLAVAEAELSGNRTSGLRKHPGAVVRSLSRQRMTTLGALRRRSPGEAELLGAAPPDPWRLLHSLPTDRVILEYSRTDRDYHLFCVERDDVTVYPGIARVDQVGPLLDELRFQLGKGVFGDDHIERFGTFYRGQLHDLFEALGASLLGDAWDRLAGKSVTIVPHEILHGAPFHAFQRDGVALVDRCDVSYAPSLSALEALGRRGDRPAAPPVILGSADWAAPAIDEEVRLVGRSLPGARIARTPDASALIGLEDHPSVLHIACHATYREEDPWSAGLFLGEDWVSLADIYDMPRMARIVVLSGCGTGLGRVYSGDEWVGLVRGFLETGAGIVLASLWEVHDRSAVELMGTFYDLLVRGRSVSAALSQAQREARRSGAFALHWAPLVAIGDAELCLQGRKAA